MSARPVAAETTPSDAVLPTDAAPGADGVGTVRVRIVQAALGSGSLAVIGFLLVRPGPARGDLSYAATAAGRDAAWVGHLVECLGYGLAGFGLALATCLIVRRRGAAWANAGAVMVALGGVLFAAMGYTVGVLGWYATAADALPVSAGTALLAYAQADPARLVAADVAGFALVTLGTLLICVGLWRSAAVPRVLPVVLAVLTLAQFVLPQNRALDVDQALLMASFVAVAGFAGRSAR